MQVSVRRIYLLVHAGTLLERAPDEFWTLISIMTDQEKVRYYTFLGSTSVTCP